MRIILDTNVVISGIFFAGPPYQILKEIGTLPYFPESLRKRQTMDINLTMRAI